MGTVVIRENEPLALSFESNLHPMWIYDFKTLTCLKVNESAIRVYGFSEKEFLGNRECERKPVFTVAVDDQETSLLA